MLHIFGGGIIFRRTCNRLNLIRDAALRDTLARIPVDLARWGGPEQPDLEPPFYDFRDWWCPHVYDRNLFWFEGVLSLQPGMYRDIVRYPAHTDTDEYFGCIEEDAYPTDSESEIWHHALNATEMDWQYDLMAEENMEDMEIDTD